MPSERCAFCDHASSRPTGRHVKVEGSQVARARSVPAASTQTTERCGPTGSGRAAYRKFMLRHGPPPVCGRCQTEDVRFLQVHHCDGDRRNNSLENLVWLCLNCHYLVHHADAEIPGSAVTPARATSSSLGHPGSDTPNEVKNDSTARMNRIVGQVSGVMRMIEDDRPCAEILNQIGAVRSALDQLGVQLLTGHLERRVLGADEGCRHKLLDELRASLSQFLK